jgi:7-cyano-7-deazaguanine synthase in queuosine biosynthesis
MISAKQPTPFAFDFTRADRVMWSYGQRNDELKKQGSPARFFVDDRAIAYQFACLLRPVRADLVDIASATHMADRLALRTAEHTSNWSRRLKVRICVRCPEIWMDSLMKERLEKLLAFLTEDVWDLDFVLRRDPLRSSEIQNHLFGGSRENDVEASMFSGGLDSFAGTACRVSECEKHFILISASSNPQQRFRQQQQAKILREDFGRQISHVCVPYGMHRGDEYAQEPSRRTRGFLFLILGGVTALSAGSSALYLYENGLGAINLPYDHSQIGTDNARAVHPRVLREVGELLSLADGKRFSILNRCIYKTKAEMLQHAAIARIGRAVHLTFSCDGFPVRAKGHAQCGFCTSCILRRYSLEIAGLENLDSDSYLQDWRSNSFRPTRHHLRGLRAMDWQALRLEKGLAEKEPWNGVTVEFPELRVLVNDLCLIHHDTPAHVGAKLLRVLRRHVADWPSFSALQLLNTTGRKVA